MPTVSDAPMATYRTAAVAEGLGAGVAVDGGVVGATLAAVVAAGALVTADAVGAGVAREAGAHATASVAMRNRAVRRIVRIDNA